MPYFILFLVTLGIIIVVGHGCWLMLAFVGRNLFDLAGDKNQREQAAKDKPRLIDDHEAFKRFLTYLNWKGWLEDQQYEHIDSLAKRAVDEIEMKQASHGALLTPAQAPAPRPQRIATGEVLRPHEPPTLAVDPLSDSVVQHDVVKQTPSEQKPIIPKRSFGEILQSFLVDHNIRWGELAAGILIVVCSVGLVISLWSTLTETHRLFPAAIFLAAVAAIEGAGLYTLRRWKLRHTSRAVLIIATMLVPLSMMAGISVAGSGEQAVRLSDPLTLLAIAMGWGIGFVMLRQSGLALVGRQSLGVWLLGLGIPTALLPFAAAFAKTASPWTIVWMTLGSLATSATTLATVGRLNRKSTQFALLPAMHKRLTLLVSLSAYTVTVLLSMIWLRGQLEINQAIPYLLALVPFSVILAASAHQLHSRMKADGYRLAWRAVSILAVAATVAIFPAALRHFEWISAWTASVACAALVSSILLRNLPVITLVPISLAVYLPLVTSVYWTKLGWDSETLLWQRYGNGPSVIVLALLSTVCWGLHIFVRRQPRENPSPQLANFFEQIVFAGQGISGLVLVLDAIVGLGPDAWLQNVPLSLIVLSLLAVALGWGLIQPLQPRLAQAVSISGLLCASAVGWNATSVGSHQGLAAWTTMLSTTLVTAGLLSAVMGELSLRVGKKNPALFHRWWFAVSGFSFGGLWLGLHASLYEPIWTVGAGVAAWFLLLGACWRAPSSLNLTLQQLGLPVLLVLPILGYRRAWLLDVNRWISLDAAFIALAVFAVSATFGFLLRGWLQQRSKWLEKLPNVDFCQWFIALAGAVVVLGITLAGHHFSYAVERDWMPPKLSFLLAAGAALFSSLIVDWYLQATETIDRGVSRRVGFAVLGILGGSLAAAWIGGTTHRGIVACGWTGLGISIVAVCWMLYAAAASKTIAFHANTSKQIDERKTWQMQTSSLLLVCFAALFGVVVSLLHRNTVWLAEGRGLSDWLSWSILLWSSLYLAVLALVSRVFRNPGLMWVVAVAWPALILFVSTLALGHADWELVTVAGVVATYVLPFVHMLVVKIAGPSSTPPSAGKPFEMISPTKAIALVGALTCVVIGGIATWQALFTTSHILDPEIWWGLLIVGMLYAVDHVATLFNLQRRQVTAVAAGLTLLVGSGLSAAIALKQNWIPANETHLVVLSQWLLLGALASIFADALRVRQAAIYSAILAITVGLIIFEDPLSTAWRVGIAIVASLLANATALLTARRNWWPRLTQLYGVGAALLACALLARGVGRYEFIVGLQALLISTIVVAWRVAFTEGYLRANTAHASPWFDRALASVATAVAAIPCLQSLLNRSLTWSADEVIGVWLAIAAMVMLIATTAMRWQHRPTVATSFVASQWVVLGLVGRLGIDAIAIESVTLAVVTASTLAGLWVWAWPLTFGLSHHTGGGEESSSYRLRLMGRGEVVAMLWCLAAIEGWLAVVSVFGSTTTTDQWLTLGALAMCAISIGVSANWFETHPPLRIEWAMRSRVLAVLVTIAWMVLSTGISEQPLKPWGLVVAMRLFVVAMIVTPSALWALKRLLRLRAQQWQQPLNIGAAVGGGLAVLSLVAMLIQEVMLRSSGEIAAVSSTLVAGIAVLLGTAAVLSAMAGIFPAGRTALPKFTDDQRRLWLYAAEGFGFLAWLHVFLCRPEWALLGLRPYWPYIVMGLAFASAGIAQLGARMGDKVLYSTLRQSTLFLPLIPMIGFWLSSNQTTWMFGAGEVSYSFLLLVASLFYGGLALLWRQDRIPRVAAIIAGNCALWVILSQQTDASFMTYPQFWLIPPAVCLLFAVQLERNTLPKQVVTAVRYGATLVIYASSTADVLLGEIGVSLWGPVVLIVLALIGMVVGALLRIRAFLFLGTAFVLVGVLSMVWHAGRAIDQSWPWWVFGITTGCLILGGLMAAEKHRNKLRLLGRQLAAWE